MVMDACLAILITFSLTVSPGRGLAITSAVLIATTLAASFIIGRAFCTMPVSLEEFVFVFMLCVVERKISSF